MRKNRLESPCVLKYNLSCKIYGNWALVKKVLVAFIGSILILSSLGLSQGVFAQNVGLSDSPHPSAQEIYDLESLSAAAAAPGGGQFLPQPAGTDVDTMLGNNEPHVVVNPLNSANVAVSSVSPLLRLSLDGGATFPIVVNALLPVSQQNQNPQYFFCGDPSLTFDSQGRLFWSYLTCSFSAPGVFLDLSVVVLQVNPTTGATIGNAVDVTPGNFIDDKNWIAADANPLSANADNLYIVWVRFDDNLRVRYSMSVDQGVNWTPRYLVGLVSRTCTKAQLWGCTRKPTTHSISRRKV